MKKRLTKWLAAALAVSMLVAGCSSTPSDTGSSDEAATPPVAANDPVGNEGNVDPGAQEEMAAGTGEGIAAEDLKVGLLLNGPVNDGGWNASAYAGLLAIEEKFGCYVNYQEGINPSSFAEVYRAMADEGYNVLIGHGYEFGDAAMEVAESFPDIRFIVTSTDISQAPNVSSMKNNYYDMGYLVGIVAAYMTESNIVGAVGGEEMPPITEPLWAFEASAKKHNPDLEVYRVMTGSFEDTAKAKETAISLIEQGADIVFQDADQSGLGVFDACKEKGVYALGAIADQGDIAPDTIITSGITDISKGLVGMIDMVVDGSWGAHYYMMGVRQDAVSLAPFRAFEDQIPQECLDALEQAIQEIEAGTLNTEEFTNEYKASQGA